MRPSGSESRRSRRLSDRLRERRFWLSLLVLPHRSNRAEQTILLAVRTRGEIERIGAGCAPAAQGQLPQPVDNQGLAVGAIEFVDESPARVEHVDLAVAEIADEDVAAEPAEGE